jgi:hypothetical protein
MKPTKGALVLGLVAALMAGAAACSDVGDDSGAGSSSSGGSAADGAPFGYDSSPTNDAGGGGGGDTTVPGSDTGSSAGDGTTPRADGTSMADTGGSDGALDGQALMDSSGGDSTVESGVPESGATDTKPEDGAVDVAAETGPADTGTQDTGAQDAAAQDTGTPDTGTPDTGSDSGSSILNAHCKTNNSGAPCTPTELLLIEHDTNPDGTAKGSDPPYACYDCMVNAGCMDDTNFVTDVNHECGDTGPMGISAPTLSGDPASAVCLNVVTCILANKCANDHGSGTCYCGTALASACTMPGAPNGACLAQEQDGTNSMDPPTVNNRFTNIAYAAGMANTLFSCAASNTCTSCD